MPWGGVMVKIKGQDAPMTLAGLIHYLSQYQASEVVLHPDDWAMVWNYVSTDRNFGKDDLGYYLLLGGIRLRPRPFEHERVDLSSERILE